MREIAGFPLQWWKDFAKEDNCLARMVPSDLRQILGYISDEAPRAWILKNKETGKEDLINGAVYDPTSVDFWISADAMKLFEIIPLYKGKNLQ